VDIRSETEFAEEESEMGYAEEDVSGRCATILANGKRCPNASLPGSRYCGLPAHQALEGSDTDYLVPPEDDGGDGEEQPDGDAEGEGAEAAVASSDNGDLPIEDLVVDEAVPTADEPVPAPGDDGAATATADQPTDEEPVPDEDPVPEDPPVDPEAEVPADADDPELEVDAETETPDESAADADDAGEEAEGS
jgi:N utilization substance protein A